MILYICALLLYPLALHTAKNPLNNSVYADTAMPFVIFNSVCDLDQPASFYQMIVIPKLMAKLEAAVE
jgi:hypothetical protein